MVQEVLIPLPAVCAQTSLSRSSIYALIKRNLFPRQIRLGANRSSRWVASEIEAWVQKEIASSRLNESQT